MPGKEIIILGSGDIGMIMARRMTLEGAHVQAVFELMPYPSGLPRNIVQCLDDYNIPLYLSHTVTEIHGRNRLTGVTISEVDADRRPISGTEKEYACDTLILSVGLIPENNLLEDAGITIDPHTYGAIVDENLQTSVPGIFSAGNVLHVHDLVDFVSMESETLARHASAYIDGKSIDPCTLDVKCGEGVGHTIPQKVSGSNDFNLSLRVRNHYHNCHIVVRQNGIDVAAKKMKKQFTCIVCPNGCEMEAEIENGKVVSITSNLCPRGEQYICQELTAPPRRTIASSVLVKDGELPVTSVRLTKAIPKEMIFPVMDEIRRVVLIAPVKAGTIALHNVCGLDSDVMVTKNIHAK